MTDHSAAGAPGAPLDLHLPELEAMARCTHDKRSGGNDYILCDNCGLMWDYRRETWHDGLTRLLLEALRAAGAVRPQPQDSGLATAERFANYLAEIRDAIDPSRVLTFDELPARVREEVAAGAARPRLAVMTVGDQDTYQLRDSVLWQVVRTEGEGLTWRPIGDVRDWTAGDARPQPLDSAEAVIARAFTGDGAQLENLDISDNEWAGVALDVFGPGYEEHFEVTLRFDDWLAMAKIARAFYGKLAAGDARRPQLHQISTSLELDLLRRMTALGLDLGQREAMFRIIAELAAGAPADGASKTREATK